MTKDEYCAHALTLAGDERWNYQEKHGVASAQVWMWKRDHTDIPQTRAKKTKTRIRVLASQGGCCALCGKADAARWFLNKTGKVLCYGCNQFVNMGRKLRAGGVEWEDMESFIE